MTNPTDRPGGAAASFSSSDHMWDEPQWVAAYVARNDQRADENAAIFGLMARLAPFAPDAALHVLDIGAGYGTLSTAILEAFPNASAVGLDLSEPMMAVGRERMAHFGGRFRFHCGDFSAGLPPDLMGPFNLIVSARAIHHLPGATEKRRLYTDIYATLTDGGCFLNFDHMWPRDPYLQARYRAAQPEDEGHDAHEHAHQPHQHEGPRPGFDDPAETQLLWLREAGFAFVDCFWKRLGRSLIGGYKRAAVS